MISHEFLFWYVSLQKCFDNTVYNSIYLLRVLQVKNHYLFLMKYNMIKTIYVGRLDIEKWIPELIRCYSILLLQGYQIKLDIHWDGPLRENIQELAQAFPEHIFYHWRQHKQDILPTRQEADYFVMPSQFLETFGLTACESLLLGTPVIGNKKGWLIPFVEERLDIQRYIWSWDDEKLVNLFKHIITQETTKHDFSSFISKTQQHYTKQKRYEKIHALVWTSDQTLFVNDYITYSSGGVETHLHDAKKVLEHYGISVSIYWSEAPHWKNTRITKLWRMALSLVNISSALQIKKTIKQQNITTLRRHSISRRIGRRALLINNQPAQQFVTHHELWLFHPYPSKITTPDELPQARSLRARIRAWKTKNPLIIVRLIGRYVLTVLLHRMFILRQVVHLVPSERMIDMVKDRHPNAKVVYIPHFVAID